MDHVVAGGISMQGHVGSGALTYMVGFPNPQSMRNPGCLRPVMRSGHGCFLHLKHDVQVHPRPKG